MDVVIMIPAYNPDEKFTNFLKDLHSAGYDKIVVIDDGSRLETKHFFDTAKQEYQCTVLSHSINLGQGRAYKTGFNYYLLQKYRGGVFNNTFGIIQCDCDGQHCIEDIDHCSELLRLNPDKFILGVRDFRNRTVPFRSRFGNRFTSFIFRFLCGLNLKDTQSGLKGIPASLIPFLMETKGERFEYASSVLLETKKRGVKIIQFPIQTIYINENETSHFNPLLDSIRIYSLILKYLMSSLSAFIVDVVLFSIFVSLLKGIVGNWYIVVSTYLAKIFSCTYGYVVNKRFVFQNKGKTIVTAIRFLGLCIVQATCSGLFTYILTFFTYWNEVLCKIIVDTLLFFISFQIQNCWVFHNTQSQK